MGATHGPDDTANGTLNGVLDNTPEVVVNGSTPRTAMELVRTARDGCVQAFAVIHGMTEPRVRGVVRRMVVDTHATDDVVQETYLRAFRSLPRLTDVGAFDGWLLRIARNTAYSSLKRGVRERPSLRAHADALDSAHGMPRVVYRAGSVAPCPRTAALVRIALAELPDVVRETLRHRYEEGLSCEEIAERQGVSRSCVKTRLFRARKALRGAAGLS